MKLMAAIPACAEIQEVLLNVEEEEAGQQIQKDGCGPLPPKGMLSKTAVVLHPSDDPTMPTTTQCWGSILVWSGPITKSTEIKTVR
jgi:hypothetical protein